MQQLFYFHCRVPPVFFLVEVEDRDESAVPLTDQPPIGSAASVKSTEPATGDFKDGADKQQEEEKKEQEEGEKVEEKKPEEVTKNGKSEDSVAVDEQPIAGAEKTVAVALSESPLQPVVKSVPGTTLRRLEDPIFESSWAGNFTASLTPKTLPAAAPAGVRAPRYRVLEAPDDDPLPKYKVMEAAGAASGDVFYQPLDAVVPSATTCSPYKVLEAPLAPSKSAVSSSSPSPATNNNNRSLAGDVMEKARTRFDRFWGRKDSDK